MAVTKPGKLRDFHRFGSLAGPHILVVDGSRVYALDPALADAFDALAETNEEEAARLLVRHGLSGPPVMLDKSLRGVPPLRSLSLSVAASCNLGCSYCYAQQGSFGGTSGPMGWDVARQALTTLITGALPGERVQVAYLGGEPFANRALIQKATSFAVDLANSRGVRIAFAVTTNGTLLSPADGDFLARYRFAITVSIDGTEAQHDSQRYYRNGIGSYRRIMNRLRPLLDRRDLDLAARVTVTPNNLDLLTALESLSAAGFRSVGFSPVLNSPTGVGELDTSHLNVLLDQMVACGTLFLERTLSGSTLPFENIESALREIHRGTHRPYACGAGAGYLGVSAEGDLFACHRFVGDADGAMGDLSTGINKSAQRSWLSKRAVDRQEPCRTCWARYLCGGGCHHEVIHRGRPACDYIRGWLDFCLSTYASLLTNLPEYFEVPT